MVLVMYLLGSSIHPYSSIKSSLLSEKRVFYLLFVFFIAYTLSIAYSYFFIPQDAHLYPDKVVPNGMHVWFQNEYKRLHVHEGRLISTIIAYYLTFTAILFPFLFFKFKTFRERKFYYVEWLFLVLLSLFALYISNIMGRRTVLFLFVLIFLYFASLIIVKYMIYWIPGLKAMLAYPFGGAHEISVAQGMKLAHNTWIDIGKDYGIIPFVTFVLFCIMHVPYILKVLFSHSVSHFIKHQITEYYSK